jgi:hypothetical protein
MRNLRLLSLAIAACVVLGLVSLAAAGIPSAGNSTASLASAGQKTMYICPRGDGETFGSVGATINVTVRDGNGNPIANFPFEDIWVESVTALAIKFCQGGISADLNTDINGNTVISAGGVAGGGCTQGGIRVVVGGSALTSAPGNNLNVRINSPDIVNNRIVGLDDVGPFSAYLNGAYNFCGDYFDDGLINLADVGIFSTHLGHQCQ